MNDSIVVMGRAGFIGSHFVLGSHAAAGTQMAYFDLLTNAGQRGKPPSTQ